VLTRAYQQSSAGGPELLKADPANLLVGRMNRKRLTYESLRDSLLLVSGQLSLAPEPVAGRPVRTMFEPIERKSGNDMRAMFDGPDPKGIVPDRADTTTAPQALFMLNNKLVLESADKIAAAVAKDPALIRPDARPYANLPGGHQEGWADAFFQVIRDIYSAIVEHPSERRPAAFATFEDGYRVACLVDAVVASHRRGGEWTTVQATELVGSAR
jgi:hypothetical protein